VVLFLFICQGAVAQSPDSVEINRKRLRILALGGGAGYTLGWIGLHQLWYKDQNSQSFRWFNDNREWKQMDKAGHFFTAFYLSDAGSRAFQWTGMRREKSDLWGSMAGVLLMAPIEWFDGHSEGYGASWGDLLANTAGAAFYLGQQQLWREIRLHPKFSFSPSPYASERPSLLGETYLQQMLKDYNGQTYWISVDMGKFLKTDKKGPWKWINLAIGYSANDMVFARNAENKAAGYSPYRQGYLSLDLNLSHLKSRSPWINTGLFLANMIKVPAPTFEWNTHGIQFHFLHF
jgi:uncharacterized protein YfiM (DUF2279 family)